jgi:hypothetical protein
VIVRDAGLSLQFWLRSRAALACFRAASNLWFGIFGSFGKLSQVGHLEPVRLSHSNPWGPKRTKFAPSSHASQAPPGDASPRHRDRIRWPISETESGDRVGRPSAETECGEGDREPKPSAGTERGEAPLIGMPSKLLLNWWGGVGSGFLAMLPQEG